MKLIFVCVSQTKIYDIIKELGGTAYPKEIKQMAREKYPDSSLHSYVYHPLKNLKRWGIVEKNLNGSWTIVKQLDE